MNTASVFIIKRSSSLFLDQRKVQFNNAFITSLTSNFTIRYSTLPYAARCNPQSIFPSWTLPAPCIHIASPSPLHWHSTPSTIFATPYNGIHNTRLHIGVMSCTVLYSLRFLQIVFRCLPIFLHVLFVCAIIVFFLSRIVVSLSSVSPPCSIRTCSLPPAHAPIL